MFLTTKDRNRKNGKRFRGYYSGRNAPRLSDKPREIIRASLYQECIDDIDVLARGDNITRNHELEELITLAINVRTAESLDKAILWVKMARRCLGA